MNKKKIFYKKSSKRKTHKKKKQKKTSSSNPYVVHKHYFKKRVQHTKHFDGCITCCDNDDGFCRKHNQWCYMCSHNCNPNDMGHTYSYKQKHGKWKHIKY